MAFLRVFLLLILLSLSAIAYPAEAKFPCKKASELMKETLQAGYGWLSQAVSSNGYVIQVYTKETGEYKIIGIDNDLNACVLIAGDDWKFVFLRGA